ncbi:MAG: sigma 54-interacting transcriptional regulator [Planctomycetes bacterium]|nr:sigma 54-interacting transcriptional regulator [Planctomycetota bacterium]
MITLIVETAGRRQPFVFPQDAIAIGRNEDNDLRVGSRFVSQHHCRLERLAKGWKIVDLKSQNGTRVNGVEITQKMLRSGDRIEIGHVNIWLEEAPDEHTEPLEVAADEVTPAQIDAPIVSSRGDGGTRGALGDDLHRVMIGYRKTFGDERGLVEVERAVTEQSARVFPRAAFSTPADAARLLEITKAINSELNLKRCLTLIIDSMIALTDAERGFLILHEEDGRMKVSVARNFDRESVTRAELKFSRSIADEVGSSGKAVISTSAQDDRRFDSYQSVGDLKLRSVLCVPFRIRERVIGVLYLDHRFRKGAFTEKELELVSSFADPAAIAIENARLYEENQRAQEELITRQREVDELNALLSSKLEEKEIELARFRSHAPQKEDFRFDYSFIIGDSPRMLEIFQLLERVIPADVPVLVTGESGTGKELIAKAIHVNSNRHDRPFVKENCAAIPETLLESELFGYKKGAFTGADRDKIGLFQQADGGTLFLDEIGEMSLDMQKKLLRVLQENEIRPVGARETLKIDVRLVSASNRNLKEEIGLGGFREDLYYRLNVIAIEMPPLRERLEDIPLLVDHFLGRFATQMKAPKKSIDESAMRHLLAYHWPGNVRELENEIQRACAIGGEVIGADDFSPDIRATRPASLPASGKKESHWKDIVKMTAQQKEREMILKALEENGWKKAAAARALEISRPTLDAKIKSFGLEPYLRRGKKGGA